MAHEKSPAIAAARDALVSSDEEITIAKSLPQPTLTYGHFIEEVETRVGPQESKLAVRQSIPTFGKRGLKRDVALAANSAAKARYGATVLSVEYEVRALYSECALLERMIEISSERIGLVASLETTVRTLFSAGEASYGKLSRIELLLAERRSALAGLIDSRASVLARLAAAVGTMDLSKISAPGMSAASLTRPSDDEYRLLLPEGNPELAVLSAAVEGAQAGLRLSRRNWFPDLVIGLDYIETGEAAMPVDESGKDAVMVSASVALPLWGGQLRAGVRKGEASRDAAVARYTAGSLRLSARLEEILVRIRDAERRIALHELELLPRARQERAVAEAAYGGGGSITELVDAEEHMLTYELGLAQAQRDLATRIAEADMLTGRFAHASEGTPQ